MVRVAEPARAAAVRIILRNPVVVVHGRAVGDGGDEARADGEPRPWADRNAALEDEIVVESPDQLAQLAAVGAIDGFVGLALHPAERGINLYAFDDGKCCGFLGGGEAIGDRRGRSSDGKKGHHADAMPPPAVGSRSSQHGTPRNISAARRLKRNAWRIPNMLRHACSTTRCRVK